MDFYRDLVTQKSWLLLQALVRKYDFVLIGGWAVWLHTHRLKSKDIDVIVEFDQLDKLKDAYPLTKNDRLKKYEVIQAEIHIDIYVPHYSQLGLPIDQVISSAAALEGFRVPPPEILLLLKQAAYTARAGSAKGQKDLLDIISLLSLPHFNWNKYLSLAPAAYIRRSPQAEQLTNLVSSPISVPELGFNPHQYSRLKKIWRAKLLI